MSFLETPRFPSDISFNSKGGPNYNTQIVKYGAGYESREIKWDYPMHSYDVAYGIKTIESLYDLVEFFHAVKGRGHSFLYKDHLDYKSCDVGDTVADTDQTIGTGDGAEKDFQLIKTYTSGALSSTRYIGKPVSGSVVISIDDVAQGSGWTVNTTTGVVTFTTEPAVAEVVKAGYEFDVPARFNEDSLSVDFETYRLGGVSVPIIEDKYYSQDST